VQTGTVDLVIIILYLLIFFDIIFATAYTFLRSADTPSFAVGVPTAIKIISDSLIALFISVVKKSLFAL